jgi:GntR family transcriptional regulator/MocR family aminotransferase
MIGKWHHGKEQSDNFKGATQSRGSGEEGTMTRGIPAALTDVQLDGEAGIPLYRQLYEALRDAILAERLVGGQRLPSTRTIAGEFGISRNTVLNAVDQLLAEGYIEGRRGAGTYVASVLPDTFVGVARQQPDRAAPRAGARTISRRGARIASVMPPVRSDGLAAWRRGDAFDIGGPALDHFPRDVWQRIVLRRWRQSSAELLAFTHSGGYVPLRAAIAAHLATTRGVRCAPEQVLIVTGCQQAVEIAARVLLDPGDAAWIEDPGYIGARNALVEAGAALVPVPLDRDGLVVSEGVRRSPRARMAYVSPSFAFPAGATLSLARRLALLEWAGRAGAWVLEDDYDSEYRFAGRPLAALQSLDTDGCVIYAGTFERMLFPALRLGYLVVPPALLDAFGAAFRVSETLVPLLEQAAVADFIAEGHFARHIRRMRALYGARQRALLDAAASSGLDRYLDLQPAEAGMHLVGWLPPGIDDRVVSARAAEAGVMARALSHFAIEPQPHGALLLGYAATDIDAIHACARRLTATLGALFDQTETNSPTPLQERAIIGA